MNRQQAVKRRDKNENHSGYVDVRCLDVQLCVNGKELQRWSLLYGARVIA
ncbi:hypothetical protein [Klebsiella pneumoniae]|nr:hypothetical protein [Klebsiella pneumoniae]EMH91623.1 hypothetical protein MTE1_4747 [Klebsiella pneumoniae JHCK1]HBW7292445.1 hypothetical protein [Klebsiella pneumoniae]